MISAKTGEEMIPVLYVDIDDTIRKGYDTLGRFVNHPSDVEVFEGVADLLWKYKDLGWRIVGVSNQGGITLGHLDPDDCFAAMIETSVQTRQAFDKLMWCQHHPDADTPEMAVCWCRKPKAGMVIEAALALAEKHPGEIYPPHLGVFVGDRPEDQECATNAGLAFVDAVEWRAGKHLEVAKEGAAIERHRETVIRSVQHGVMSTDEAREALGMSSKLPSDYLDLSLKMTGVKTKTVPVYTLEVNDEFVFDGMLYVVTHKNEHEIKGQRPSPYVGSVTFYKPPVDEGRSGWNTEVITEDN